MRGLASNRWKMLVAAAGAMLVVALLLSLLDPAPASAGISLPNPLSGIKSLIGKVVGAPISVAGKLGATALKQALEWLLGDLQAVISLRTIKFLTSVDLAIGPSLAKLTGPMIVIGGFFLVVGLITSVGDGYRDVIAGTDTAPRVIGSAIFRIIGLALLLASWFWLVPLAIEVANGLRDYLLSDQAVQHALGKSFRTQVFLGTNPLFGLLLAIAVVSTTLLLVVLKFVIVIAFAMLYIGGPVLIGLAALPRIGSVPLAIALRGVVTLTIVPLTWTVVFVAWAGVTAGILDGVKNPGDALVKLLTGPGLYLAGVAIIVGVTKKLLALATLGVPLALPGARLLRTAVTVALTRGLASAAMQAGAATAAHGGQAAPVNAGTGTPGPSRPTPPASTQPPRRQGLTIPEQQPTTATSPSGTRAAGRPSHASAPPRQERRARAANAVFPVNEDGTFAPLRPAPSADEQASMVERMNQRRAELGGEVTLDRVEEAGRLLTAADRAAFAAAAKAAVDEGPSYAERHFTRAVARQATVGSISGPERQAAVTIGAAAPEVVHDAFSADYESFGGAPHRVTPLAPGAAGPRDPRLFSAEGHAEILAEERARRGTQQPTGWSQQHDRE